MTPGIHHFECYQGATFSTRFYIASQSTQETPRSLDGYAVRMQVRKKASSEIVVIELTTENGRAMIGDDHKVTLTIDALDTADLTPGKYVYDVELVAGDVVAKPLFGSFTVIAEITR